MIRIGYQTILIVVAVGASVTTSVGSTTTRSDGVLQLLWDTDEAMVNVPMTAQMAAGKERDLFYRVDVDTLHQWDAHDSEAPDRQEDQDDSPQGIPIGNHGSSSSAAPPLVRNATVVTALCGVPSDEYANAVRQVIREQLLLAGLDITSTEASDSPEGRALNWIMNEDPVVLCPTTQTSFQRLFQRYLLVLLFVQLSGPTSWVDPSGFMTGSSECDDWYGVECDSSGHVTSIRLKRNGLRGTVPPAIMALPNLRTLSLDHNFIRGTIPSSLGVATNLQVLELDDNRMNGTIPTELYMMVQLQALDLNTNMLSGTLSPRIENLSNLVVLQLEDNRLTGPLPTESLQRLKDLVLLTLHGNPWSTGSTLELLCEGVDARRAHNPAYVQFLSFDCAANATDPSLCPCCSTCEAR